MELEHDLKLFGFFIADEKLQSHRNLPSSQAMQDQEPQLPSTSLSLSIIPKPTLRLFGVEIDIENPQPKINKAKIPKKIIKRSRLRAPKPQPLPLKYRDLLLNRGVDEGTLKLILTRTLNETDMKKHHARLSMPRKQVKEGFLLNEEEAWINGKKTVEEGKRALRRKLDVTVVDPSLGIHTMKLAKRNHKGSELNGRNKSWWYALTNDWVKLARENGLFVGQAIQVWSFWIQNGKLGFLIHKMEELV